MKNEILFRKDGGGGSNFTPYFIFNLKNLRKTAKYSCERNSRNREDLFCRDNSCMIILKVSGIYNKIFIGPTIGI